MVDRKKGRVAIGADRGWLRLRWTFQGKRQVMALGLPDDPVSRAIAQRVADQIALDMAQEALCSGSYDQTLAKYRQGVSTGHRLAAVELFGSYVDYKRKTLGDPNSLLKWRGLVGHVDQFFKRRAAADISEGLAFEFRDWLLGRMQPITAKERLGMLRSCWNWGRARGLVEGNPWAEVRVKVPPKAKPKPFTLAEIERILSHARAEYAHWADLIEFCLSVGCRPGEAAGLQWRHLADDCSSIWIGEAWGRGRQKGTKTNQARSFGLFPELQQMLLARRPAGYKGGDRVFTSPGGNPVDDHNFRRRVWAPLLADLGIPYRKPYTTRHTFTSHALDQGMSVAQISEITGHSPETLIRHYVGGVAGKAQVPRLYPSSGNTPPSE